MKKRIHLILVLFTISFICASYNCPLDNQQPFPSYLYGYHFTGRWIDAVGNKFYDTDFYIPVQMSNNIPQTHSWMPGAIDNAAIAWSNINNSYFNIQIAQTAPQVYTYNYGTGPITNQYDNVNLIGFSQGDIDFPISTSYNSTHYLAMTRVMIPESQYTDASHTAYTCAEWYHPSIIQVDIVINPYVSWALIPSESSATDNFFDFTTNALHEFGHLAGLKHFGEPGSGSIMDRRIIRGMRQRGLYMGIDDMMMRFLYGGCDVGQIPFIPCSRFEPGDQFLIAAENPYAHGEDGCCGGCNCNSSGAQIAHLSETALKNIILYGTQNCYWNINKLRRGIVENQAALIDIVDKTKSEYADVQLAMQNCIDVNGALVDATFRCDLNVIEKDLTLEQKNIDAMITVIDEFLALDNISQGLKNELSYLKTKLPEYQGLNIKEAAILYDASVRN
jgi:hypothetical protein